MESYVRWFRDIRLRDVPLVGGKTASLGELYSVLSKQGVKVPNGFAVTAAAYRDALTAAGAWHRLHALLDALDKRQVDVLAERAAEARKIVFEATGGNELRQLITAAYRDLETEYGRNVAVAVRSSATAEDLPTASFAGQHESFLNVRGPNGCSKPAGAVLRRSLPTARYRTGSTIDSTTSRSPFRSAS